MITVAPVVVDRAHGRAQATLTDPGTSNRFVVCPREKRFFAAEFVPYKAICGSRGFSHDKQQAGNRKRWCMAAILINWRVLSQARAQGCPNHHAPTMFPTTNSVIDYQKLLGHVALPTPSQQSKQTECRREQGFPLAATFDGNWIQPTRAQGLANFVLSRGHDDDVHFFFFFLSASRYLALLLVPFTLRSETGSFSIQSQFRFGSRQSWHWWVC